MTLETDLIKYRREKAAQTLEDARFLFEGKRLSFTVNRIYFALFYEVIALLKTKNLSSSKHAGVRTLFNEHFVKTGIVETDIGKFYAQIFAFKQKGDYDDFIYFEEEKVRDWLEKAETYLKELEECIAKEMSTPNNTTE